MKHHPIFYKFNWQEPFNDDAFSVNCIGVRQKKIYDSGVIPNSRVFNLFKPDRLEKSVKHPNKIISPSIQATDNYAPAFNEEYFEWIDILESVVDYVSESSSNRKYKFMELGSGFGRWSSIAVAALRQISNKDFQIIAVDAELQHLNWLREHFSDNGIEFGKQLIFHGPLNSSREMVYFLSGENGAWYGQAIIPFSSGEIYERSFEERKRIGVALSPPSIRDLLFNRQAKKRLIKIQSLTLDDVLAKVDGIIDLVDIDIQGAEADVIEASIKHLSKRVKRLHIGTHSYEVEVRLKNILGQEWRLIRDYSCLGLRETEFGQIAFGDGVQSWTNPEFITA